MYAQNGDWLPPLPPPPAPPIYFQGRSLPFDFQSRSVRPTAPYPHRPRGDSVPFRNNFTPLLPHPPTTFNNPHINVMNGSQTGHPSLPMPPVRPNYNTKQHSNGPSSTYKNRNCDSLSTTNSVHRGAPIKKQAGDVWFPLSALEDPWKRLESRVGEYQSSVNQGSRMTINRSASLNSNSHGGSSSCITNIDESGSGVNSVGRSNTVSVHITSRLTGVSVCNSGCTSVTAPSTPRSLDNASLLLEASLAQNKTRPSMYDMLTGQ